nr:putative cargo-transport protein ypp1 [Quercus suber]
MNVVTGKAPNAEKGKRYLAILDQALCNAEWGDIPEHARKVEKHAPERKGAESCNVIALAFAARSEAQVASASHRPTSASSTGTSSIHSLGDLVPKLTAALESPGVSLDDVYVVKTCLAEIYWLQESPAAALSALPDSLSGSGNPNAQGSTLGWLEVCNVKVSFIKAAALQAVGQQLETKQLLLRASRQTPGTRTPELRKWTERLLARACVYNYDGTPAQSIPALNESLQSFRAWAMFWQRATHATAATSTFVDIPRRQIWKSYYQLLSVILQRGLIYGAPSASASFLVNESTNHVPAGELQSAKLRQREEVKRIENIYESLLLNETQFPKSSDTNVEVEEWIEQAVSNWKIFTGPSWSDTELEHGAKGAVSRGMLDMLYRAATKTFHSTAILRQLFAVHASVGEFELAMHAFRSYEEIIGKGKARAAKTGKHVLGFDNDDVSLTTAAEAVRILCRYGDRAQGEMAVEVTETISDWLEEHIPIASDKTVLNDETRNIPTEDNHRSTALPLQPKSLAAAYRAIGISRAHWARLTFEPETRSELQADSISNLRRAQSYDPESIDTAYALARVLAETRNIPAAIEVAKRCIAASESEDESDEVRERVRKQHLIPLWHLLGLCLSARDEYEPAGKMCTMAFDQFEDSNLLFGPPVKSSQDTEKLELDGGLRGLIDLMDSFEKESIVQIKLTQLTLIELVEGAGIAVDMTGELLSLYARLFGSPEPLKLTKNPPPTATSVSPSKAGGTLRSLAGSIKAKSVRPGTSKDQPAVPVWSNSVTKGSDVSNREQNLPPIAITVTNEDGIPSEKQHGQHHHLHLPFRHHGHNDGNTSRSANNTNETTDGTNTTSEVLSNQQPHWDSDRGATNPHPTAGIDMPKSAEQPLAEVPHNIAPDDWPAPAGHDDQPLRQDVRLPAPHPSAAAQSKMKVASLQDRRHAASILVKVWLFIAGLYIRADLYEDASGAVGEATKLVETLEAEMVAAKSNAQALFHKGWGGGKSVDELWADIWSARGDIASARNLPFQAIAQYEQALSYFPDHLQAIIGISDYLMDIYEQKLPPEEPRPTHASSSAVASSGLDVPPLPPPRPDIATSSRGNRLQQDGSTAVSDPHPAELNRLAARDRAYMLLSNLTRLGTGWDNPEAWFTLARSHELSKQVSKAKQALWWVVELEDCRPIRDWREITAGGYTL